MTRALFLSIILTAALGAVLPRAVQAQEGLDDVVFFHSVSQDARISAAPWLEGHLFRRSYDASTVTFFGAHLGVPFASRFEAGFGMQYTNSKPDLGPGISGISNLYVHGRYTIARELTRLAAGAFTSLPIGSEDVGEGDVDVGVFVAARHPIAEGTVLSGKVSFDHFGISEDDTDPSFRFHAGLIRQVTDRLALLGELLATTLVDSAEISGGADYALTGTTRLRGSIGVGLDENASNSAFSIGFVHGFEGSGG